MNDVQKIALAREMLAAWDRLDWERVLELFAEDGVLHTMMDAPVVGRDALRRRILGVTAGLSSLECRVRHVGVIDGLVFVERLDVFTIAGRRVELPTVGVLDIRDGHVHEWREYFDRAQFRGAAAAAASGA